FRAILAIAEFHSACRRPDRYGKVDLAGHGPVEQIGHATKAGPLRTPRLQRRAIGDRLSGWNAVDCRDDVTAPQPDIPSRGDDQSPFDPGPAERQIALRWLVIWDRPVTVTERGDEPAQSVAKGQVVGIDSSRPERAIKRTFPPRLEIRVELPVHAPRCDHGR